MSVKMKLGIWEDRWEVMHVVDRFNGTHPYPYHSKSSLHSWTESGLYANGQISPRDLIRFICDLPGTASAESGAAGAVTVSTADPWQTLRRMRQHHNSLVAEAKALREASDAAARAADDLESAIIRLEKEVEG